MGGLQNIDYRTAHGFIVKNDEFYRGWTFINVYEGVDVGGNQFKMFPNQDEYEQLHNMDNYAHDNDVFGDAGYDDTAHDDGVPLNATAHDDDDAGCDNTIHNAIKMNDIHY
ncbi:hypothetical protein FNV43_RR21618 [Rhamnella rubrinervis]|uniref:Uncharacterized protein n=1 Tax=Rhamnella rubrinervis TaxID=2594499 RepID=A0A8K0GRS6_9ROSA|nr:hypothetical protein FNV43_RR21618 [Rhamnella rubrinervis]